MENNLNVIKSDLLQKIMDLKLSVDIAAEKIAITHSDEHIVVKRLKSYYPGIEKSLNYVNQLDSLMSEKRYSDIEIIVNRVKAISEMIKDDARDLLLTMQTGFEDLPDNTNWN